MAIFIFMKSEKAHIVRDTRWSQVFYNVERLILKKDSTRLFRTPEMASKMYNKFRKISGNRKKKRTLYYKYSVVCESNWRITLVCANTELVSVLAILRPDGNQINSSVFLVDF